MYFECIQLILFISKPLLDKRCVKFWGFLFEMQYIWAARKIGFYLGILLDPYQFFWRSPLFLVSTDPLIQPDQITIRSRTETESNRRLESD